MKIIDRYLPVIKMVYQEDFHHSSQLINTPRISVDDTDSSGSLAATHRYQQRQRLRDSLLSHPVLP